MAQTPRGQETGLGDIELRETGLDFDEGMVYAGRPSVFASRQFTLGSDEGARALAVLLKANRPALAQLDLSWNGVGLRAARALSDALRNNTELGSTFEAGFAVFNGKRRVGIRV